MSDIRSWAGGEVRRCERCGWFELHPLDDTEGICRRHPPVVIQTPKDEDWSGLPMGYWPSVAVNDWCAEFAALAKNQKPRRSGEE